MHPRYWGTIKQALEYHWDVLLVAHLSLTCTESCDLIVWLRKEGVKTLIWHHQNLSIVNQLACQMAKFHEIPSPWQKLLKETDPIHGVRGIESYISCLPWFSYAPL